MKKILVFHYDAFSTIPNKGNPAGVVFENTDVLSDDDMQAIAFKVGFNETVFVVKSDKADLRLRYFTPGHEINLCGHATMASLYCLKTRGLLGDVSSITIETNVGILPIQFINKDEKQLFIRMKQDYPQFVAFNGDKEKLAHSIGLTIEEISEDMPIVYGSTGAWTLLIPIRSLESFSRMKPLNTLFPELLSEMPRASLHPFCLQSYNKSALMHARHFSSPYSGTVEDPVTGTASGVMGAYYMHYLDMHSNPHHFVVEQGQEIGRDGRVNVEVYRTVDNRIEVYITGTAVYLTDMNVEYE